MSRTNSRPTTPYPGREREPSRLPFLGSLRMAQRDMREISLPPVSKTSVSKSRRFSGVRSSRISS